MYSDYRAVHHSPDLNIQGYDIATAPKPTTTRRVRNTTYLSPLSSVLFQLIFCPVPAYSCSLSAPSSMFGSLVYRARFEDETFSRLPDFIDPCSKGELSFVEWEGVSSGVAVEKRVVSHIFHGFSVVWWGQKG